MTKFELVKAIKENRLGDLNLRGVDLSGTDLSYTKLEGAYLAYSNFEGTDLEGAKLAYANLEGADLAGADLAGADLEGAKLVDADLSYANLSGATLPEGIPVIDNIDQKIYDAITADPSAFDMADWHSSCGTQHCRAGWTIVLAGEAGEELEDKLDTNAAAALIYAASGSHPVPLWYASNADALADIKRRAGVSQ